MKTRQNFVHLHVQSDYSFLWSIASVEALVDRAEELGMKHLALTDFSTMFGIMEFIEACKRRQNPIKPIIGCEVCVTSGSRFEKPWNDNQHYYFVLLAENKQGYLNLVKLISLGVYEKDRLHYRPLDNELLAAYHEGLIALFCFTEDEISSLISKGKMNEAEQKVIFYNTLFGKNNFYLEIQDQSIAAEYAKYFNCSVSQKDIKSAIVDISRRTGIPLVATNEVRYLKQEDSTAQEVFECIREGNKLSDKDRFKPYSDQFYLKSSDEMADLFCECPEAIANTVRIAERCDVNIQKVDTIDLYKYLPDFEIPDTFNNVDAYLQHLINEGLKKRYPKEIAANGKTWEDIQKRAEYELNIIVKKDFSNYFLIVADYVQWAREHSIPIGPGRGSSAGSIVLYALNITNIDPLKYGLLFERFFNSERICIPDIDIDLGIESRDDVIQYITGKYGKDRVAKIVTFSTKNKSGFGEKGDVFLDVASFLGIPDSEANMISTFIPDHPKKTLQMSIDNDPVLRDLEQNSRYAELFRLAKKLEGLKFFPEILPASVVISKKPLIEFMPLSLEGTEIVTQYDINFLESCGLIKYDLLGLKFLDVIKDTVELVRRRGGNYTHFSIDNISESDPLTFELFGEGKTDNVFPFRTDGEKSILRWVKPEKLTDLIAINALFRPGLMENIPQFIETKNGKQQISYPDPCLEGILKETYGIIVYQEQIMKIIQRIADYSLGKSDILRRTMSKKNKEQIDNEKIQFIVSAIANGFEEKKAAAIFDTLVQSAACAFLKSHSVSYTIIAYQTAYLKANFPEEFNIACNGDS